MKKQILILAALALAMPAFAAETSRASKKQTVTPARTTAQPARVEKKQPKRSETGEAFTVRISTTPDINQHMKYEDFFDLIPKKRAYEYAGSYDSLDDKLFTRNMCAPASVANHLIWLDLNFFPDITDETDRVIAGVELARTLGGSKYMKTVSEGSKDKSSGSTIYNVVKGAYRLLQERGVTVKNVKVISVSSHLDQEELFGVLNGRLTIETRAPKVYEIKEALRRRAIVLNLFGKYTVVESSKEGGVSRPVWLERGGGHFFAPVGYGEDRKGNYDGSMIIYHNPADDPQNKQRQQHKKWVRETGRNADLMLIKKKKPDFGFRACPNNANWTCYGKLGDTYVRDKPLKDHGKNDEVRILEALIVIEV